MRADIVAILIAVLLVLIIGVSLVNAIDKTIDNERGPHSQLLAALGDK
jgi:hypothetical protein